MDKESIDAVQMYLREIGKISLIDAAKERELAKRIEEGDDEAKNILIKANLRLVVSIAKRYVGRSPDLSILDLIQEGQFRIVSGDGKIQLAKGLQIFHLRHLVDTAGDNQSHRRSVQNHQNPGAYDGNYFQIQTGVKEAVSRFGPRAVAGRNSRRNEFGSGKNPSYPKIDQSTVSFEAPVGDDDGDSTLGDFVADDKILSSDQQAARKILAGQFQEILNDLTPKEQKILQMRFGLGDGMVHTLEEVGKEFG